MVTTEGKIQWKEGSVTIPENYGTDGASVPRPAWIIVHPVHHTIRRAALGHDRLYEIHKLDDGTLIDREFADTVLFFGMVPLGGSVVLRYLVWSAVRVGGAHAWMTGPERREQRMRKVEALQNTR